MATTLTLRLTKGSQLTAQELDDNFTALDSSITNGSGIKLDSANDWTALNNFEAGLQSPGAGTNSFRAGTNAGATTQGASSVALGENAGQTDQLGFAVAIGNSAGQTDQGVFSVGVGTAAGKTAQGNAGVAVGVNAGSITQGESAVGVGNAAAQNFQSDFSVAVGASAGQDSQHTKSVAIGYFAGNSSQDSSSVAIGDEAGRFSQSRNAVSIGRGAGKTNQGLQGVAIGYTTGQENQGAGATAVGWTSGKTSQGTNSVAIGFSAGKTSQGASAISIGYDAGQTSQGLNAVAVGVNSGATSQGGGAVAIGNGAGENGQGSASVALGQFAGRIGQGSNGIIISSNGSAVDDTSDGHIHIASDDGSIDFTTDSGFSVTGGNFSSPGYKNVAVTNNGNGATPPVSVFVNDITQTITGAGDATFGQNLPSLLEDTSVMSLDRSGLLGSGSTVWANNTVKFSGLPAFGSIAGPYNILRSNVKFQSTTTSSLAFSNFAVDINNTISNESTGTFTASEYGINHRPIIGADVTALVLTGMLVNLAVVDASSTLEYQIGFHSVALTVGTLSNVGFMYGPTKPTDGRSYAFHSGSSLDPVLFGGGVVNRTFMLQNASGGGSTPAYTATTGDHTLLMQGTQTQVILPAHTAVPLGQTYKIINDSGSSKAATSSSSFMGKSATMSNNTSATFVAGPNGWWVGY